MGVVGDIQSCVQWDLMGGGSLCSISSSWLETRKGVGDSEDFIPNDLARYSA